MTYVMSIERLALEQGKLEGRVEGKIEGESGLLQRQLVKRFGPLPDAIQRRLDQATSEQLESGPSVFWMHRTCRRCLTITEHRSPDGAACNPGRSKPRLSRIPLRCIRATEYPLWSGLN